MAKHTSDMAHTLCIALVSVIVGIGLFLFCWVSYSLGWYQFDYPHHMLFFAVIGIVAVPYVFLIFSYCFSAENTSRPSYKTIFGIKKTQSIAVVCVSFAYCLYSMILTMVDEKSLIYNIPFLAMSTIETIVVIYAGYDIINSLNLRWFLRTSPYCITGICFVTYAAFTMPPTGKSVFQNTDSLANAVLSFVTITYFIQVFNERFCKEQDDGV
ncbi:MULTISPECIES: hypothetical protein [Bifidobacterium]|uniref:hypothetical protein n=1 Tax=Bifidobacterium TaxID=1678 RepID=UPI0018DDA356|nr:MULTISPECIES: hypothetical protein [Bifidobacterium]MBI0145042.1 hypothetical protein [Bifidobacterium polysaccharolyticum]MBI0151865.1 hypothetical protein [Bifidobacterium sp. M0399]